MIRSRMRLVFLILAAMVGLTALYAGDSYRRIRQVASVDRAGGGDAIVVLGAAQYNGKPSPVLKARLDHALALFAQGFANVIITTGGFGPDPNFSEAHVSAQYLAENGVDASQIVTEQGSGTTLDTVRAASRLMRSNGWRRALVVSDGFHLYRLERIFADEGIEALTSPAPDSPIELSPVNRVWFSLREVALLSVYRLGRLFG